MKLSDLSVSPTRKKEEAERKGRREEGREEAVLMHEWLRAIVPENATGTRDILRTFTGSNPATLITTAAGTGGESAARCDDRRCCTDVEASLAALSASMTTRTQSKQQKHRSLLLP